MIPLDPRTAAAARRHGLESLLTGLRVLDALGPRTFLALAAETAVLVSDSGGLQEECTVIGRPMVVLRRSTERPESLVDFARLAPCGEDLAGVVGEILEQGPALLDRLAALVSPFGDGTASERIGSLTRTAPRPSESAPRPVHTSPRKR